MMESDASGRVFGGGLQPQDGFSPNGVNMPQEMTPGDMGSDEAFANAEPTPDADDAVDGVTRVNRVLDELVSQGQRFALSSDIWRYATETARCDVLITTPPEHARGREITMWLIDQIKRNASGIKIEVRYHALTSCYALYLTASYISLLKGAELLNLRKWVKPAFGGGQRAFVFEDSQCYVGVDNRDAFLTGQERANIVRAMLDLIRAGPGGESLSFATPPSDESVRSDDVPTSVAKVGVTAAATEFLAVMKSRRIGLSENHIRDGQAILPALLSHDLVDQVLPLHQSSELESLRSRWVTALTDVQPLDDVRHYFGPQIAMYFAWLGHLTTALWAPALLGLLIYWFGTATTTDDGEETQNSLWSDLCFVVFALFNCFWSTVYLESWKRRQAELAFQWGTLTVENHLDEPRPEFKGDYLLPSPVTGRLEPYYPQWKHTLLRFGVAFPLTCLCWLAMFTAMFWVFRLQDITDYYFANKFLLSWVTILPNILYAIVIIVGDALYRQLATFLNDLENYRTNDEYENNLIIKIVGFQCVSAFGSLFYIAFYLRDMQRLQETLATLLIVRQVIQNVCETAVPYVLEKLKLSRLTYQLTRGMTDAKLRTHVSGIKRKRQSQSEQQQRPLLDTLDSVPSPSSQDRTLATLLIVRQVIQNVCETAVPYVLEKLKLSRLTYQLTRGMTDAKLRTHVSGIKHKRQSQSEQQQRPLLDTLDSVPSPSSQDRGDAVSGGDDVSLTSTGTGDGVRQRRGRPGRRTSVESIRLAVPEFKVGASDADGATMEVTQAELESLLPVYERPLDDYLEIFIQFGYVLLFSPAFPLAAVCALANDLIEIRVDAFKLCNNVQRPFARRVKTIGAWQRAMEVLGVVGVLVNCALIGQSGLVQRVWPDMGWGEQVFLIVVLEHLVLALKFAIDLAIPDTPGWVRLEMAKMEHRRNEAFKRESRLLHPANVSSVVSSRQPTTFTNAGSVKPRSMTPGPS